jgi:hypothetical protein
MKPATQNSPNPLRFAEARGSTTVEASVRWEGVDWGGVRLRRVILTLPHLSDEPGEAFGMDSRMARKVGEMLIAASDKADALKTWEFES